MTDQVNETELVFLITPRFVSDVEPSQLPTDRVGRLSTNPSDQELYIDGYTEVPRCNDDCPVNDSFGAGGPVAAQHVQGGFPQAGFQGGFDQGGYSQGFPTGPVIQSQGGFPVGAAPRQAAPARHANSGFSWPTGPKVR